MTHSRRARSIPAAWDPHGQLLLADAQTSGGLLLCVPPEKVWTVLADLHHHGDGAACVIGDLVDGRPGRVRAYDPPRLRHRSLPTGASPTRGAVRDRAARRRPSDRRGHQPRRGSVTRGSDLHAPPPCGSESLHVFRTHPHGAGGARRGRPRGADDNRAVRSHPTRVLAGVRAVARSARCSCLQRLGAAQGAAVGRCRVPSHGARR